MLALLLVLAAEPMKDADGAIWTVQSGKRESLGGGMASRQKLVVLRNGKKVGEVEAGSFSQSNPDISEGTEWKFQVTEGKFEAVGTTVRHEKEKRTERVQVLRWDGKQLSAPAPSPPSRSPGP